MLKRVPIFAIILLVILVGVYSVAQLNNPSPQEIDSAEISMELGEKYNSISYPFHDYFLSIDYYQRASDLGKTRANAYLAHAYYYSKREEVGCEEIERLARSAIETTEKGRAYNILANIYYYDYCGVRDINIAESYYLLSFENGFEYASVNLAFLYTLHKPDPEKADYWNNINLEGLDEIYSQVGIWNKLKNYTIEIYKWYKDLFV